MNLLSSNIFTKKVRFGTVENITLLGVSRNHDDGLTEYLRQKLQTVPGLTLRGIADRSDGGVTHSYLSKILSGAARNPSIEKLRAIAAGIPAPEKEVFDAAHGAESNGTEAFNSEIAVMFKGWNELSENDKKELLVTVRMLAAEVQRRRPKKKK